LRTRAKEKVSPLTREYIEQLEDIVRMGYLLWKHANDELAPDIPELRDDLYAFHKACRKVGHLLPDASEGGPVGLGFRKIYLPSWLTTSPDQYITGDDIPT